MSAHDSIVRATVVYNPLDIEDRTDVELIYSKGKSLSHYLDGLPSDVAWGIALNNEHVPESAVAVVFPAPGDHIVVAPVPHGGGDDSKSILSIVATLALAAFAPWAGGALASAMGFSQTGLAATILGSAVSVAGGLLINSFLPKPDQNLGDTQQSFGIDGPKNTSSEGVPVPVIMGKHGFGGNLVDLYTENVTDENGDPVQYLYGRLVVSEGPIKSVGDIHINDQPLSSYEDVEIDQRLGFNDQTVTDWFNETVSLFNQARDLSTTYQTYTTISEVDRLRLDFNFPAGLVSTDSKGRVNDQSVTIEAEYRQVGGSWKPFFSSLNWVSGATSGDAHRVRFTYTPQFSTIIDRGVGGQISASGLPNFRLEYRVNGGSWVQYKTYNDSSHTQGVEITETLDGFSGDTLDFRIVDLSITDKPGTFVIEEVQAKTRTSTVTITDKSQTPIRRTFKTDHLPEGNYEIRYRRTEEESQEDRVFDKVTLTDVGEIITDNVGLVNTAWLGFKIKLTGQLSSVPKVDGIAEGLFLPIFDQNGVQVDYAYTRNPADIAIATQIDTRWGGKLDDLAQIDWPAFAEWRDFCVLNNLTFDGLFSETSNIDEALKHIFMAGRAQRVRVGSKISVAMDGPAEPVQLFNSSLIEKNSLEISYLPFADRVNDLAVSFFDEEDRYRQRTVRAVNDDAINRGEPLKTATVQVKGMTSRARAQREANFRINYNRHVVRTASWVAPLQSLNCTVGSVVLLQTEMVDWGVGGRLKSGSTATKVILDRDVEMTAGKVYSILVHRDTRKLHDYAITSANSNLVTVGGLVLNDGSAHRLIANGEEFAITRVIPGAGSSQILLEPRAQGYSLSGNAEIWTTDVLDTVDVTNPVSSGTQSFSELDLDTALTDGAPPLFSAFMFGEKSELKRPFRITEMVRREENKAELMAIEYVEEIYDDIDVNTGVEFLPEGEGQHVTGLTLNEISIFQPDGKRVSKVDAQWSRADNGTHISALVQVKIDDGDFRDYEEAISDRIQIDATIGQTITVRVIARTRDGLLGFAAAPAESIDVTGNVEVPVKPIEWQTDNGPRTITFIQPIINDRTVDPYKDLLLAGDPDFGYYRLSVAPLGDTFANSEFVAEFKSTDHTIQLPVNTGEKTYFIQVFDNIGNGSDPSDPLNAFPESPRRISIAVDDQSVEYDTAGQNPSPATIVVTADPFGEDTEADVFYEFLVDGVSVQNTTSNTYNYTPAASAADMPQKVKVQLREQVNDGDVLATDFITVVGLKPGGAPIMVLSNEVHVIPTANDGSNPNLVGASTTITVFSGVDDDTANWTLSKVDSGVTSTLTGTTLAITGISADAAYVDVTATKAGSTPITKRMTLTRLKAPLNGDNGSPGSPGSDGEDGDTLVTGQVFYQTAQSFQPGTPFASSYNTSTGAFTGLRTGWGTTQPDIPMTDTTKLIWSSKFTVRINGQTGSQTITFSTPSGSIVVTADMRSDNYVSGVNGWRIDRDSGYAEFGAATIRGQLTVNQILFDTDRFAANGSLLSIKSGGIVTDLLANNSASRGGASTHGYRNLTTAWSTVISAPSVDTDGSPAVLVFKWQWAINGDAQAEARIRRDSTTLGDIIFASQAGSGTFVGSWINPTPGDGNRIFNIQMKYTGAGNANVDNGAMSSYAWVK